jgi:hypothetical protein
MPRRDDSIFGNDQLVFFYKNCYTLLACRPLRTQTQDAGSGQAHLAAPDSQLSLRRRSAAEEDGGREARALLSHCCSEAAVTEIPQRRRQGQRPYTR